MSRRVHICTHGIHNVSAPPFSKHFFTPDTDSDGRLRAFELLGRDLRGLEFLTLGACETALGRFNAGDNLRGIPAALLSPYEPSLVASPEYITSQSGGPVPTRD